MPKPYFLRRPAGLYVRFFVPTDLQALIGSRYLVRPVRLSLGDAAHLAVARTAVALSEAFDRMRRGASSMKDDLLSWVQPPFSRTLTRRPIKAMRSVHVKAQEVHCRVQAWRG
ncbi:hypothetical protein XAB3213_1410012 [Xanthomonas citri pv. bilvae]|nr:hypothetical protein XAB3213_1410012 [Xanthomonas citri pv. bilvae]